jgi:hypothetical protein
MARCVKNLDNVPVTNVIMLLLLLYVFYNILLLATVGVRNIAIIIYFTFSAEKPNLCDTNNGGCEQTCTNNLGVAVCTCVTGTLNDDTMSCDGGNIEQHFKEHVHLRLE